MAEYKLLSFQEMISIIGGKMFKTNLSINSPYYYTI